MIPGAIHKVLQHYVDEAVTVPRELAKEIRNPQHLCQANNLEMASLARTSQADLE